MTEDEFPNRDAILNTVKEQLRAATKKELQEAFFLHAVEFQLNFGHPGWREFLKRQWFLREFAGLPLPTKELQRAMLGEDEG